MGVRTDLMMLRSLPEVPLGNLANVRNTSNSTWAHSGCDCSSSSDGSSWNIWLYFTNEYIKTYHILKVAVGAEKHFIRHLPNPVIRQHRPRYFPHFVLDQSLLFSGFKKAQILLQKLGYSWWILSTAIFRLIRNSWTWSCVEFDSIQHLQKNIERMYKCEDKPEFPLDHRTVDEDEEHRQLWVVNPAFCLRGYQ